MKTISAKSLNYIRDVAFGFYIQRRTYGSRDPNGDIRLDSEHYRAAKLLERKGLVKKIKPDCIDRDGRPYISGELIIPEGLEFAKRLIRNKRKRN